MLNHPAAAQAVESSGSEARLRANPCLCWWPGTSLRFPGRDSTRLSAACAGADLLEQGNCAKLAARTQKPLQSCAIFVWRIGCSARAN